MKTLHLSIIAGTIGIVILTVAIIFIFNLSQTPFSTDQKITPNNNQNFSENQSNALEMQNLNNTYRAGYPASINFTFATQDPNCENPSFSVTNVATKLLVYGPTLAWNYTDSNCLHYDPVSFFTGLEKNQLITKSEKYLIQAKVYGNTYKREFTVTPSEYSGKNIIAESGMLPGNGPALSCPATSGPYPSETILGSNGFDGVNNLYLNQYGDNKVVDYFLKPGHSGSIMLKVQRGFFQPGENIATGLLILNQNSNYGNFDHPGVSIRYEPEYAPVSLFGSTTFSVIISASQDSLHGTYWMYLPPGGCAGGELVLLTIGDRPMAQPPDLIGYDPPIDFSFSESPILTATVLNFGIHTFDNCSLTYTNSNKTLLIKNFDEIPPGFVYKYHFDSNPVKGDKVTFECKSPHIVKNYSPN